MITVYAVDAQLCLMHATQSASKGFRDVVVDPTVTAAAGEVLKWVTTLDPIADAVTFGTEGTGEWQAIADYRKTPLYLTADGTAYTLDSTVAGQSFDGLGVLPMWLTSTAMPGPNHEWVSGTWTLNVAAQLASDRAAQTALISASCQSTIYAGATSSALGSAYTYPTDDKNQANMTASVVASTLPNLAANWTTPFLCADSSGVWAMRPHTAAQIQQAGSDIKAFVVSNIEKNATLAAEIAAATTSAAVKAITW